MIRLAEPQLPDESAFLRSVGEILRSSTFTKGRYVEEFEANICQIVGAEHCVAVSSGTAALHLSVLALDSSRGLTIAAPGFTFPATANAIEWGGASTQLVDVDLASFGMSTQDFREDAPVGAAMVVHPFGSPADISAIRAALPAGTPIIEDAAAALGARFSGKPCGMLGDLGCFSFHPRKIVTTGEGGAVVTNDLALAEAVRTLRNHGSLVASDQSRDDIGLNYRLPELSAALGLAQLPYLADRISQRREIHRALSKAVSEVAGVSVQATVASGEPAWSSFICRVEGRDNSLVIRKLAELGVEATIGSFSVADIPYYLKNSPRDRSALPNSRRLAKESVALPFHEQLTYEEIGEIASALSMAIDA